MEPTVMICLASAILAGAISVAKLSKESKKGKNKSGPTAWIDKPILSIPPNKPVSANKAVPDKRKRANAVKSTSLASIEDREHDWLARQLREEAASEKRFSAMYGLKQAHKANCPARSLREEHRSNCDADGVDVGRGK